MRNVSKVLAVLCLLTAASCQRGVFQSPSVSPATLKDVPAQRLNFRFESDVPPPDAEETKASNERIAAIQNDFDTNRPLEILVKTIPSPDGNRVLVVYSRAEDEPNEYRLDMYAPDGRVIRHITPDGMAVHFPDTIVWSPDSTAVAFVAMVRQRRGGAPVMPENPSPNDTNSQTDTNTSAENANTRESAEKPEPAEPETTSAVPEAPTNILTFRTEQIYLCNSEGEELRPITQNEGLIYFYYVWSPDSSALAALASTFREWQFLQFQADKTNEVFVPRGRPRIVEKNGRERRLDDNLTPVHPVWSPDSAKVAVAFDKQIRIYDAIGETPTQAAIPLRNQLLISSQKYDQELQLKMESSNASAANGANANSANANSGANANAASTPIDPTVSTLPDESTLVSFNPIIDLLWSKEDLLYFQTGFVKQFKSGEGSRSYLRWHRLVLSPQAVALGNQKE